MVFVVVLEPLRNDFENYLSAWQRVYVNIIPFEGFDEGFRHTVALRAIDRRKAGFEIDLPCEDDRFLGCVCRAVVREHLDCLWGT